MGTSKVPLTREAPCKPNEWPLLPLQLPLKRAPGQSLTLPGRRPMLLPGGQWDLLGGWVDNKDNWGSYVAYRGYQDAHEAPLTLQV